MRRTPNQNTINANKRTVLRTLLNNRRADAGVGEFKTVRGYNKLFGTATPMTYRIMNDLVNTETYTPVEGMTNEDGDSISIERVKTFYKEHKGTSRRFAYIVDGVVVLDRTVDIPDLSDDQFERWLFLELFVSKFMLQSDTSVFDKYGHAGKLYSFSSNSLVNVDRIKQSYLDGLSHCVFAPILKWATELRDKQDPEKSNIKKYNAVIHSIEKFAELYKNGVPEDKCDDVCKKLNVQIEINYLFTNQTVRYGKELVQSRHLFQFTNTRLNHIDEGELVHNTKPTIITMDELYDKLDQYDSTRTFYYYKKSHGVITHIYTLNEAWATSTELADAKNNLEKEYNLQSMYVDAIGQKRLSDFIARGTHYNCSIEFPAYEIVYPSRLKCIDQEKAYYNFHKCKYYDGFLGKITDFRRCDKIMGVGLYLITDLQCKNKNNKLYQYNQVMNVYKSNNVYPSPALQFLKDNGFTFDIIAGCYGIEKLDFEFGKEMLNKVAKTPYVDEDGNFKMKGSSFYSLCTGMWDSRSDLTYRYLRGTEKDAQVIKQNSENNVWYSNGEIRVGIKRKQSNHLGHLTAFILEYQRISLMIQLFKMDIKKVANIYVDGIYYLEHPFTMLDTFGKKDTDTYSSMTFNTDTFISNLHTEMPLLDFGLRREHYKTELFLGAGGNGKTHFNINDIGLIRPVYSAPTHKLNSVKHNETGIPVYTCASLLSKNPELQRTIQQTANVLIIDEVSMMSNEEKEELLSRYSNMKIIMCGDVGYQLPCFSTYEEVKTPFSTEGFEHTTTMTKNYRVKCNKLARVLHNIRNHIDGLEPLKLDMIQKCSVADMENMYTENSIIIARTNKVKDGYTATLKAKGFMTKWYVVKTGKTTNAGEIIISENKPENGEIRHGYTAHCIQGETMKHQIFIDYKNIKIDIHGLYTAISRAEYLEQIYFIEV